MLIKSLIHVSLMLANIVNVPASCYAQIWRQKAKSLPGGDGTWKLIYQLENRSFS